MDASSLDRDVELAKAAWARRALMAQADVYLAAVGPMVLRMRGFITVEDVVAPANPKPHLAFSEIAERLTIAGIRTARGGPWTPAAAASIVERVRARCRADAGFVIVPAGYEPPPSYVPEPPTDWEGLERRRAEAERAAREAAREAVRAERQAERDARRAARQQAAEAKQAARDVANAARRAGKTEAVVARDIRYAGAGRDAAAAAAELRRSGAEGIVRAMSRQTHSQVAAELNRRGVARPRSSLPWTKPAVAQMRARWRPEE